MEQRKPKRAGTVATLVGLAVFGCATSAAGIAGLRQLQSAHLAEEVFVTASPRTFQAWLASALRVTLAEDEDARSKLATAIAGRLLLMRIEQQFALVQVMVQDRFWGELAADEAGRQRALSIAEDAVDQALALSPGSGALWLMAAKIRTVRGGFDGRAYAYLRASQTLAAGEGAVVRARFVFSLGILALLDDAGKARFEIDRAIIRQIDGPLYALAQQRLGAQRGEAGMAIAPGETVGPVGSIRPLGIVRPVPALRGAAQ